MVELEPTYAGCYHSKAHERVRVHHANLREFLVQLDLRKSVNGQK